MWSNYKEYICPYCKLPFWSQEENVTHCMTPSCISGYLADKKRAARIRKAQINNNPRPELSPLAKDNAKARKLGLTYGQYKGIQLMGLEEEYESLNSNTRENYC